MFIVNKISQGVDLGIRFTLEVLGASGAIWGTSEVVHLRNDENKDYWRVTAIVIGALAFIRFVYINLHDRKNKEETTELLPTKT
ncbi:MAG: hypothetical protein K940chlam6_00436 [Chlamydiae bacterium]|nr:hypothetical protein [Chlamydiota bacterium]